MERHCPQITVRNECLIPPPDGYKPPIRWPKSKDQCWYRYVSIFTSPLCPFPDIVYIHLPGLILNTYMLCYQRATVFFLSVRNVPYDWISNKKSTQHWLRKEGDKFFFPGGGTMFPNGVNSYVKLMQKLIPGMKNGTIRTAIDTGCGVSTDQLMIQVILKFSVS